MLSSSCSTTVINKAPAKELSTINSKLSASVSLSATAPNSNSGIYINRNISKSYDFNGHNGDSHITEEFDLGGSKKEDDGFFKKILNYSFKKKRYEQNSKEEYHLQPSVIPVASPRKEDNTSTIYITSNMAPEPIVKLSLPVCDVDVPEMSGYKKIKAGPAARQRIFPKEIFCSSEVDGSRDSHRYSSNVEVNRHSTSSSGSGSIIITTDAKIIQHKSEEYLVPKCRKLTERTFDDRNEEEQNARKYQSPSDKLKNPRIYGLSPYQQRIAKIAVNQEDPPKESPTKRKVVEKSKSFRVYNSDNLSNNLTNANNLPSLPNLTNSLSIGNFSNNFLETEHKFFSMTENINVGNSKIFKDYISNVDEPIEEGRTMVASNTSLQKFEINDNNLLNPRELEHIDHQPKSIILTTNTIVPPEPNSVLNKSNQNISQIEETIDKLVSSSFVSIIKDAGSSDRLDQPESPQSNRVPEFMKIQLNRVETARPKSNVVLSTSVPPSSIDTTPSPSPAIPIPGSGGSIDESIKARRFSNENIEITESKPPLPPSAVIVAARSSFVETPKSPLGFKRSDVPSKRNSVNVTHEIADDRKVILQRRTSVTEEKIKYERRISSSSEDIKYERKKSGSEDVFDKRNSNYNSGSSSGDELVVLRKKSIVDNHRDKDKDTPELMKVFARRSLKLRSDDDYRNGETKPLSSVDSDKENHSSEEKLDKIVNTDGAHIGSKSISGGIPKETNDGKATVENNSSNDVLRKTNPKPFGVPNRFGNASNVQNRNTTSFGELRKSLIPGSPTSTAPSNNSFAKNGTDSNESSGMNNNNNNNNNHINSNRHTIATMNQFNLNASNNNNNNSSITNGNSTTIETIREVNEFKGILQRRAEWEKRAKEGFK